MKKRDTKRIQSDQEQDQLLETAQGRAELWGMFQQKCQQSSLISLLESVLHLDGDIIECGVFRGSSLWMMGRTVRDVKPARKIFALDSFAGFPADQITNKDASLFRPKFKLRNKFKYANDTPERIRKVFAAFEISGEPLIGFFEQTLPQVKDEKFCFAHIDSDTHASHVECLHALYDQMIPGGVIAFDDYHETKWPGATKAIDEFFASRPETVEKRDDRSDPAWFVRKA
jgi:predicted O-methyltransferase YrrM